MDNKLEIILSAKDLTGAAFARVKNQCQDLKDRFFSLSSAMIGVSGVGGMGLLAKQSLAATAEMQKNAAMAGVSARAYQEWSFAADTYRISQDALTDGFKELTLRAEEFVVTGAGPGKEAFERLGYSQDELNGKLADSPALMLEIIDKMQGMSQAARIRLADEIFGGEGGEQFVAMINGGSDAIRKLTEKAHDLGLVLDDSAAKGAREANQAVNLLAKQINGQLNQAMADLAPAITHVSGDISDWIKNNQNLIAQNIPDFVNDVGDAVSEIKQLYDIIPDEIKGPGGVGLIGAMLLGPTGGFLAGGSAYLFREFKDFAEGLEGLRSGHISMGEFFGDESEFEAALAHYRDIRAAAEGQLKTQEDIVKAIEYTKQAYQDALAPSGTTSQSQFDKEIQRVQALNARLKELMALKVQMAQEESSDRFRQRNPFEFPEPLKDDPTPDISAKTQWVEKYEDRITKIINSGIEQRIKARQAELDRYKSEEKARPELVAAAEKEIAALKERAFADEKRRRKAEQDLLDQFNDAHKQATLTTFEYNLQKLDEEYDKWDSITQDKLALEAWYTARLKELRDQQTDDLGNALDDFFGDIDAAAAKLNKDLETEAEKRVKAEQKRIDEIKDANTDMFSTTQDHLYNMMDDWDNAGDYIVGVAKSTAKEMAAAFMAQKIVMPVMIQAGGALGMSWGGVPMADMAGGGSGFSPMNLLSSGNTAYKALTGGLSTGTYNFLTSGMMGDLGSGIFGATAWGGAGFGASAAANAAAYGVSVSEGAAMAAGAGTGAGGIAGALATAAPYLAVAAMAVPLISKLFEDDPDPRIGLRNSEQGQNDLADFYNRTNPAERGSQFPVVSFVQDLGGEYKSQVAPVIVDYFDGIFTSIDEVTQGSVSDILSSKRFDIRVNPQDYDDTGEAMAALSKKVFDRFEDELTHALDGTGQVADLLPDNFFQGFDDFKQFGVVMENTDDFVGRLTDQVEKFGETARSGYENILAYTSVMDQVDASMARISDSSVIAGLDAVTASWENMITTLEDVHARVDDIAEAEQGMAVALGANITGLTADALASAMSGGGDIDSILESSLKGAAYNSIAEQIAGKYFENFNAAVGNAWRDTGDIGAVIDAIRSIDTSDARAEIQDLMAAFGMIATDSAIMADDMSAADASLAEAGTAMNSARDNYVKALRAELSAKQDLINDNQDLIESFKGLRDNITAYQADLAGEWGSPDQQYGALRDQFDTTVQGLYSQDQSVVQAALEDLPGISDQYLEASRRANTDFQAYHNDFSYVSDVLETSKDLANVNIDRAESSIAELAEQTAYLEQELSLLGEINTNIVSLAQAQAAYKASEKNYDTAVSTGVSAGSVAATESFVTSLYWTELNRAPDAEGLEWFVNNLLDPNSGYTVDNAASAMRNIAAGLPAFADGGTAYSPTLAWIAEGGEAEHITPDSQMKAVKELLAEIKALLVALLNVAGDNREDLMDILSTLEENMNGGRKLNVKVAS